MCESRFLSGHFGGVRLATVTVFAAFAAVFFGTATIFQIEDDNPLTQAAFDATPLLGASLLVAHLAALGTLVVLIAGAGRSVASMRRRRSVRDRRGHLRGSRRRQVRGGL